MPKDVITVSNVSKMFRIPHEKKTTLFENITGMFDGTKGYEEFIALKNINFTVKKGEAIGIIGENGSGKSTLLKIISNILRPTSGSVKVDGKITSFLELGVGFQPDLTAKENIYVYGAVMGLSDKEIDDRLDEILDFSGLDRFKDTKLKNLSSGMQVRLAFATAIQTDPEILMMDEVLAVGDMEFQQKCLDVFQKYLKEKRTILFVSHDMNSVRRFCSKALLLRHGEQVAYGKTNEIIDKYVYNIWDSKPGIETAKQKEKVSPAESVDSKSKVDTPKKTEPTEEELKKIKTKWGTKKAEITGVKLIDKFGNESANFFTGDPLIMIISYDSQSILKTPVFGFEIYDEKDNYCFATNTGLRKIIIPEINGKGEVKIYLKSIPFLSGKYYITVAIHSSDQRTTYDWHTKLYSFSVLNKTTDVGFVAIDCEFKLDEK